MLRSLNVNDPEAADYMQPKKREQMSAGELRYVDEIAPAQEKELWKGRARREAEDRALTFAAEALAKRAGEGG
jgi:hypothetical protein